MTQKAIEIDLENEIKFGFWMIEGPISLYTCAPCYIYFWSLRITLFTIEYVIQYQNDISHTLDYTSKVPPLYDRTYRC